MIKISSLSLSGGQGKTTLTVLLARYLANHGKSVLVIDCDAQANSTTFLGVDIEEDDPTLLEVLKGEIEAKDCLYEVSDNLHLIPADDGLDAIGDYLSSSAAGALMLKRRLKNISGFDYCLIDSPPQRSQISSTVIGASDYAILPCESSVKGYGSLIRTLEAIKELQDLEVTSIETLGILPFRDRWVGARRTNESEKCINAMAQVLDQVFPSIRESEQYKKAVSNRTTLEALGHPDLEYPFEKITEKLEGLS